MAHIQTSKSPAGREESRVYPHKLSWNSWPGGELGTITGIRVSVYPSPLTETSQSPRELGLSSHWKRKDGTIHNNHDRLH